MDEKRGKEMEIRLRDRWLIVRFCWRQLSANFDHQSVDYGFYVHRKFKGEHLFYMLFYIFYKMCETKHLLQYLGLSFSFLRVSLYS